MTVWPSIDPDEKWELTIDWRPHLDKTTDTISASAWTVSGGLFVDLEVNDDYETQIWISGATEGIMYTLKNVIDTAQGRKWAGSLKVRGKEKYCIVIE